MAEDRKPIKGTWNRNGQKYTHYACPICGYSTIDVEGVSAKAVVERHIAQMHPEGRRQTVPTPGPTPPPSA